jgi:hypothetical protein
MTTDAKSQFVASNNSGLSHKGFLELSLGMIGADTRGGINAQVQNDLTAMGRYVETHPGQTSQARFTAYEAKLRTAASAGGEPRVVVARSNPTTGMK